VSQPILQFGTGRFLQAHVDLFVSQAMRCGEAIGGITVVQTTDSPQSSARLAALASGQGYCVELQGRVDGKRYLETVHVDSIREALHAGRDWPRVMDAVAAQVQVIVSNTADQGYALADSDTSALLSDAATAPRSFPAKLLVLLFHRWRNNPAAPLSVYPCELVSRNGDTLRDLVLGLGRAWGARAAFLAYVRDHCVWINSLVDRIVSAPLQPIGAVAEPFALWAIEKKDRMVLPCTHPAIVLTDALARYERLKLMLLNLGHTFLAERWLADWRPHGETVFQAMNDRSLRADLEAVWLEEVLPVFEAEGEGQDAQAYLTELRDRLLNPFLEHRLADIATDHEEKKRRRIAPVIAHAEALNLPLAQTRLRAAMAIDGQGQPLARLNNSDKESYDGRTRHAR
jgi:tagaturonate reductase